MSVANSKEKEIFEGCISLMQDALSSCAESMDEETTYWVYAGVIAWNLFFRDVNDVNTAYKKCESIGINPNEKIIFKSQHYNNVIVERE